MKTVEGKEFNLEDVFLYEKEGHDLILYVALREEQEVDTSRIWDTTKNEKKVLANMKQIVAYGKTQDGSIDVSYDDGSIITCDPDLEETIKAVAANQKAFNEEFELAEAEFIAGKYYYDQKDYQNALKYLNRAAQKGHVKAICLLMPMYYNGEVIEKNYAKAAKLLEQFDYIDETCNYLGHIYYEGGFGVEQDYKTAFKYFERSAKNGNAGGESALGLMYYLGEGVEQDYTKALEQFKLAAEQEKASAQTMLGMMYNEGLGVEANEQEALKWFYRAYSNGDEMAGKIIQKINRDYDPEIEENSTVRGH